MNFWFECWKFAYCVATVVVWRHNDVIANFEFNSFLISEREGEKEREKPDDLQPPPPWHWRGLLINWKSLQPLLLLLRYYYCCCCCCCGPPGQQQRARSRCSGTLIVSLGAQLMINRGIYGKTCKKKKKKKKKKMLCFRCVISLIFIFHQVDLLYLCWVVLYGGQLSEQWRARGSNNSNKFGSIVCESSAKIKKKKSKWQLN